MTTVEQCDECGATDKDGYPLRLLTGIKSLSFCSWECLMTYCSRYVTWPLVLHTPKKRWWRRS
jgi:hypothetical protein